MYKRILGNLGTRRVHNIITWVATPFWDVYGTRAPTVISQIQRTLTFFSIVQKLNMNRMAFGLKKNQLAAGVSRPVLGDAPRWGHTAGPIPLPLSDTITINMKTTTTSAIAIAAAAIILLLMLLLIQVLLHLVSGLAQGYGTVGTGLPWLNVVLCSTVWWVASLHWKFLSTSTGFVNRAIDQPNLLAPR